MKKYWKLVSSTVVLLCLGIFLLSNNNPATRQRSPGETAVSQHTNAAKDPVIEGPLVLEQAIPTLTVAVRDLPEAQYQPILERETNPRHNPLLLQGWPTMPDGAPDPLLGLGVNNTDTAPPLLTFEGTDNFCGCSPPDTVGDVGPNHYVQMVNATVFNIYDKDGTVLVANKDMNDLWTSGNCSVSDNGDPIVVYDGLADRWVLAQFSTGNGVCVAVSQTADPTGSYYGYEFTTPTFPDYFKIGVWPDAYYMSANESTYSALALERPDMLNGLPAASVRFAGQDNLLMPADVDGPTPPPANAPGLFYTFKDNSFHGGSDRLEVFEFDVDWVTPANSTFTLVDSLNITSYTYTVCGFFNLDCIPQAGTSQRVDPVSEWPMWRLAYRNFGSHQTLVGNFTIDVGSDRGGIRWFELRKTAADWTLFQEGTYSFADTIHRWMGSIAMDGDGNMALGYSRSSTSLNPSIYYTTRLASDAPGTFGSEELMFAGAGSQTGSNRWGDYSALSVDPADDCTFWFTSEYYPSNSANNWNTRVGKFIIPGCGEGGEPEADLGISKTADSAAVLIGDTITYTLDITNNGPVSATNVVVTDVLPGQVSYVSNDSGCNESSGTLTCNLGTLLNGDSSAIEIVVTAVTAGQATNTASIASDTTDPNTTNNSDSADVTISDVPLPEADLSVTQSASPDPAVVGELLTYTISISNSGPDSADNVVMTDTLPAEVSYVSNDSGCSENSGVVTCNLGTIPNGSSVTVEIVVTAVTAGQPSNTVTVSSDTIDPNSGNNASTDDSTITENPLDFIIYLPVAIRN